MKRLDLFFHITLMKIPKKYVIFEKQTETEPSHTI